MSRKTIYIIIIVVCFASTAAVLYFGYFNNQAPAPQVVVPTGPDSSATNTPTSTTPTATTTTSTGPQAAPAVFPADTKFDFNLLNSPTFKSLVAVPDLTLDPTQIGRSNPFAK